MNPDHGCAAICGLDCRTCPLYPNSCRGCLSGQTGGTCTECLNGFRQCAREHGVVRCYSCPEFPCQRLRDFEDSHWENGISHHASIITNLRNMAVLGLDAWLKEEEQNALCPECGRVMPWNAHCCRCGWNRP